MSTYQLLTYVANFWRKPIMEGGDGSFFSMAPVPTLDLTWPWNTATLIIKHCDITELMACKQTNTAIVAVKLVRLDTHSVRHSFSDIIIMIIISNSSSRIQLSTQLLLHLNTKQTTLPPWVSKQEMAILTSTDKQQLTLSSGLAAYI